MKILYVVSRPLQINTSSSIRNYATIMGLLENGHDVTLVTTKPDVTHPAYDGGLELKGIKTICFDLKGVQSFAKFGRKNKIISKIKLLIYKIISNRSIYDNLKSIVNYVDRINIDEFDIVISSSDPKSSHLFVKKLFEINKKKLYWIQIWGDPFANDITRKKNDKTKKIKLEENALLSEADKVIYVSPLTTEMQKKIYPENKDKMFFVPIPYYKKRESSHVFPNEYEKIKICYCGDYNQNIRNILPLYNSVKQLNISMTICGMSDIKLENSEKIKVLSRQNVEMVRNLESEADILVHLSNKKGTQIPGKIYQYAATDKVILFILDGNKKKLKETFEKYNRFIFVENNEEKIIDILKNIYEIKRNFSNKPLEEFQAKKIISSILKEINK